MSDRFDNGKNFLNRRNLLICDEYQRIIVNGNHFIGIGNHVCGSIAPVETHTVNGGEFGFHGLAFLNGNNAVFADLFHCFGNKLADGFVTCGNRSYLSDRVFGFYRFTYRFELFDGNVDGFCDTFFQNDGICAGGKVFKPFAYHCLSENDCGCCSVARNVVRFGGNLFNELCAHVFERIFKFDFFCYRNAVVSDERRAVLFVENNVSAFGSQRYFNGVGKRIYACFQCLSCFFAVFDLFSHN